MDQFSSRITGNREIAENYFELSFSWNSKEPPKPGQFITVRGNLGTSPLLRRPFAFSDYNSESGIAKIIYQRRGEATSILTNKRQEDSIDIIGPLGNSFPLPPEGHSPVLVAGGIGLGPILFFSKYLKASGREALLVFGARNRLLVPQLLSDRAEGSLGVEICTDDGSLGFRGNTADFLKGKDLENAEFYACGPYPMMKAVHGMAEEQDSDCWVSMEQIMACGVGACVGCAIEAKGERPYVRVCTEGPIFNSKELVWA